MIFTIETARYKNKLSGAVAHTDYTKDFVTHAATSQPIKT